MYKSSISRILKVIFFLFIFKTIAIANDFLIDENDKIFIETSNSGFLHHKNFMSQNNYNFNYIKDSSKARAGDYYQKFNLEMVTVLVMNIGMTAIMIDKGLNFLQSRANQYLENNVMVIA